MLKKSYNILEVFAKNPTISYLFGEIKEYIKSRSESYTYNSINNFVDNKILIKEKKGGVSFYKIAKTAKAISYLSIVSEYKAWKKKDIPKEAINELIEKIDVNFFSLLVVGSYAKGMQTQKSDLDIILIVSDDTKKISSNLRHFCEMNIPKIHLYVFTDQEFKQMLLDKKHNYGKEAALDNLIFYGAEIYFRIIFEAMKNGFTY